MDMSKAKDRFCASYCMTLWYISATFEHLSACIGGSLGVRDSKNLVCDFQNWMLGSHCAFVTFQYGVLGQVWYLIVSIPGLSFLSKYLTLLEIMTQLTGVG